MTKTFSGHVYQNIIEWQTPISHSQSITTQSRCECTNLFFRCSGSGCEHHCLWQCPASWSMEHNWDSCFGQSVLLLPRSLQTQRRKSDSFKSEHVMYRSRTNTCLQYCLLTVLYQVWRVILSFILLSRQNWKGVVLILVKICRKSKILLAQLTQKTYNMCPFLTNQMSLNRSTDVTYKTHRHTTAKLKLFWGSVCIVF